MATYTGIVLLVFIIHLTSAFQPEVYDISSHCGKTITVTSAVRLRLYTWMWPSGQQCKLHVMAFSFYHMNEHVSLRFLGVSLGGNRYSCSKGKVDILDTNGKELTPTGGVCGVITPAGQPYESSDDSVTIVFTKQSVSYGGSFDILATSIGYGICDDDSEFECSNSKCVSSLVTCDSYNNCGDNSDETSGCLLSVGLIIGIISSVLFVVVILAAISAVIYRRRTYRHIIWAQRPNYGTGVTTAITTKAPPYNEPPPPYQFKY